MSRVGRLGLCGLLSLGLAIGVTASASAHQGRSGPVEQPKVRVLMLGDSVALTLGWDLGHPSLRARYHYTFTNFGIVGCGVAMGPAVRLNGVAVPSQAQCDGIAPAEGTPLGQQPWPAQWQAELTKYHPNVVVVLVGRWEEVDRVFNGQWTSISNPTFAAYIKAQLELASNLISSAGANAVLMTAPCDDAAPEQPGGPPWPENDPARLAVYNQLVRQVAAEFPATDSVVDLDGLVCPGGTYAWKYRGRTIRESDGVHFTATAGLQLGPALLPAILASGRAQIERVAKQSGG